MREGKLKLFQVDPLGRPGDQPFFGAAFLATHPPFCTASPLGSAAAHTPSRATRTKTFSRCARFRVILESCTFMLFTGWRHVITCSYPLRVQHIIESCAFMLLTGWRHVTTCSYPLRVRNLCERALSRHTFIHLTLPRGGG